MKPEEIREWHNELGELLRSGDLKPHEIVRARARIEIAAQLAEMNEHLAKIANPLIVRNDPKITVAQHWVGPIENDSVTGG